MTKNGCAMWLLLVAVACGSGEDGGNGQNGDPPEDPGTSEFPDDRGGSNTAYFPCEETARVTVALDDASALGFSANDLLALSDTPQSSPITWHGGEFVQYGPESGQTEVTVATTTSATEAELVRRGGEDEGCSDEIEVGVRVTLATSGGAFEESFAATLGGASADVASLAGQIDAADLGGTFEVTGGFPGGGEATLTGVQIDATFTRFGGSGDIMVMVTSGDPNMPGSGPAIGGGGAIASWPDDTFCDYGGVRVPVSLGDDPFSIGAAIDDVNAVGPGTLTWPDDTMVGVASTLAHEGVAGCYAFPLPDDPNQVQPPPSEDEPPFLEVGGRLALTTDDGRIDHDYAVRARVLPNADGILERVRLLTDSPCESTGGSAAFATACGDFGVDVSGYDRALVMVSALYDATGAAPTLAGTLSVSAENAPECPPPDPGGMSAPGCPGSEIRELAEVPFSAP